MRVRRSLLMGLGIILALSGVPVAATGTGTGSDPAGSGIHQGAELSYTWSQNEEGRWVLTLGEGEAAEKATDGVYKCGDYYYLIREGALVTDASVQLTEDDLSRLEAADKELVKAGSYAVEQESDNPEAGLGSLLVNLGVTLDVTQEPTETPTSEPVDLLNPGWQNVDGKWLYGNTDGTRATDKTGWQAIEGKYYFLNEDGSVDTAKNGIVENTGKYLSVTNGVGVLASGFQNIGGATYYVLNGDIQKYSGWVTIDGKAYYFNGQNQIATQNTNGWKQINGNWYWFENGNVATGWRCIGGKWYYMEPHTGIMRTGLFADYSGQKYYCDGSGAMVGGGWHKIGNDWYWMHNSGAIGAGWLLQGYTWYYLEPVSGVMRTGWFKDGNTWYYSNSSGAMQTGWLHQGGNWYYLSGSGAMHVGWLRQGGNWYYMDPTSGAMRTGWYQDGNTWYYSYSNGVMATNVWIGDYYLTGNGAMATNEWIGPYWVGADGKWIPNYRSASVLEQTVEGNWERSNGNWYFRDKTGNLVTGWKYIGDYKYYFNSNGVLVQDLDNVIGRQSSYYITVNRAKCQVMVYAKDETGKYCVPVKTFACSVGLSKTPTPTGTFHILAQYKLVQLMGPSWGKYGSLVRQQNGIFFHSVACSSPDPTYSLAAGNYNMLGQPASHGCIRLCVRDAKWIYDNCSVGTTVQISDTASTPFDKPATIKIPAGQNWDPTDPDVKR